MINPIKKWKALSNDDRFLFVILLGLFAFLVLAYVLSAFRSMVNADAGYYLGVTELILKGYIPYRDFSLGYTPLFFYVLQLPRLLMGPYPTYTGYMFFLYVITTVNAYMIAVIIRRLTNNEKLALLSASLFLLMYLYLDGSYFILESFSLCCGLISMVFLVGKDITCWRSLISGACCALAFLAKQYGLLFAGVIGTMLLLSDKSWRRRFLDCIYAFVGFSSIIILFVIYYIQLGVDLKELIANLSGSTYGSQSFSMYQEGLIKTFRLFPYLLFVPCLLFNRKSQDRQLFWACCVGLLLATIQFYFNLFPHYYIFILPFVLFFGSMVWKQLKSCFGTRVCFLLFFGLYFTACALPMQSVYKETKSLIRHDLRLDQERTARQLRQIVSDYQLDSALCYWNTIQYYGLCPLEPSSMKDYGFAFGNDTEETYIKRLKDADCFIVNKREIEDLRRRMTVFSSALSEQFFLLDKDFADGTKVFIRH